MTKLFDINNGQVVMNPTVLWLPEFKKIWSRDTGEDKGIATREISYIVFLHGYNSPYMSYSERDREAKILRDYFKDMKGWKPDKVVKAAIRKFNELQDSISLRLLRASKMALEVIEEFFLTAEPDQVDKVVKNAKELGNLIKSLDQLEKQVQKEQLESSSVRGGQGIGLFEI